MHFGLLYHDDCTGLRALPAFIYFHEKCSFCLYSVSVHGILYEVRFSNREPVTADSRFERCRVERVSGGRDDSGFEKEIYRGQGFL